MNFVILVFVVGHLVLVLDKYFRQGAVRLIFVLDFSLGDRCVGLGPVDHRPDFQNASEVSDEQIPTDADKQ